MPSLKQISSRTKTVKQISKITKAMQMVSASRMKKAQDTANSSSPYSTKLYQMMHRLRLSLIEKNSTTDNKSVNKKSLILYFSTEKGLVGGLNSNVRRALLANSINKDADFICIGKKGGRLISAVKANIILKFDLPKEDALEEFLHTIAKEISVLYGTHQYLAVYVLYPKFISTTKQVPEFLQLIPLGTTDAGLESFNLDNYIFEPDPTSLFMELTATYLEVEILNALYSTLASEHSSRMVAMKNATDNAIDLAENLSHLYNVKRQQKITTEILELGNK